MKLLIKNLIPALILILLSGGCTKNEFGISGQLQSASAKNFRFLYYASDSKKGFVVETLVAVDDGKLQLTGIARNPTVVWVIDDIGRLVNLIYVERGNNLEVKGNILQPWGWQIKGNKIEDELCEWMQLNGSHLFSDRPEEMNKAIKNYVCKNPDSIVSGILLSALYQTFPGKEQEYVELEKMLSDEVRESAAVRAVGGVKLQLLDSENKDKLTPIVLYTNKGKTDTIDACKHPATLLYFWHENDGSEKYNTANRDANNVHKFNVLMLKNLRERFGSDNLFVVDINTDADTIAWMRVARKDTLAVWTRMWEPGFGMGEVSRRIGVMQQPYMVVADSTGKIRFRGYDPEATENVIKSILRF